MSTGRDYVDRYDPSPLRRSIDVLRARLELIQSDANFDPFDPTSLRRWIDILCTQLELTRLDSPAGQAREPILAEQIEKLRSRLRYIDGGDYAPR